MDKDIDNVYLEGLKVEFGHNGQQDAKGGCYKCCCPCWQVTLFLLVPIYNKLGFALYKPSILVGLVYEDLLTTKNLMSFGF